MFHSLRTVHPLISSRDEGTVTNEGLRRLMTNQNTVCRDGKQLIAHDSRVRGRDRLVSDGDEDSDKGQ